MNHPENKVADQHRIPLVELMQRLNCTEAGLSVVEATKRLFEQGTNELRVRKDTPEIIKFCRQLTNFFAVLLLAAAALAFFANYLKPNEGNAYIGVALLVVVLLNALFSYAQEYESNRIMESFRNMMPPMISVLRDGMVSRIEARLLVIGDVILLTEGDRVPADGRLIEVNQLKVDHSSLTGESEPQLRNLSCTHDNLLESRNMVFSGTLVQSGNGKALIYGTGMNTQIGHIVQLTKEAVLVETPIRKELRHFMRIISSIAHLRTALSNRCDGIFCGGGDLPSCQCIDLSHPLSKPVLRRYFCQQIDLVRDYGGVGIGGGYIPSELLATFFWHSTYRLV